MLLLSGFSTGYLQAAHYAATTGMYSAQQNNVCTGIVVDQNGETVIGASLVVKGTTNGTITGLDGDFSIPNVKKGSDGWPSRGTAHTPRQRADRGPASARRETTHPCAAARP